MAEFEACTKCGSTQRVYGICECPLYPEVDIMKLDADGNYYTRHVARMTSEALHGKSDIAAQLGARDWEIDRLKSALTEAADHLRTMLGVKVQSFCNHCGERFSDMSIADWSEEQAQKASVLNRAHELVCQANPQAQQIRSLRAKLMRERAETHEANSKVAFLASHDMRREHCSAQAEVYEAESESLIQRARRLRAEADRVERGAP